MRVKKWLLFDGIALRSGGVSPGNVKSAAPVIADFADARLAVGNGTTVSASEAAYPVLVKLFVKKRIGLTNALVENGAQGGYGGHLLYSNAVAVETAWWAMLDNG
jgi:hypothetical protein